MAPSTNGANGRDGRGRFTTGNAGGPGNPHARKVGRLRSRLVECVTADDLREVVRKLVAMAKGGDLAAIREVLDRTIGKPTAIVEHATETVSSNVVIVIPDKGRD